MNCEENDDGGQNHEVSVEKNEHAGVVKAPTALQATCRFGHAPCCEQQGKKLPVRAVQVLNMGESGEPQAECECAQRKENGAQERW